MQIHTRTLKTIQFYEMNLLKQLYSRYLRKLSENYKYRNKHNGAKKENTVLGTHTQIEEK